MNHRILLAALLAASFPCFAAAAQEAAAPATTASQHLPEPPESVRKSLQLSPFYKKYVDAHGLAIVASEKTSDSAVREAAFIVDQMLKDRDDLRRAIIANHIRVAVMAATELTTDIPEHGDLTPKDYWDKRARGLGATADRPAISCAEENLLGLEGDRYANENILIHEFSHVVHQMGQNTVDKDFDGTLQRTYESAKTKGLWKDTYAGSNCIEYWAEGVQSYFDCNDANNSQHNDTDTREKLARYDPDLFALIDGVFRQSTWRYPHHAKKAAAAIPAAASPPGDRPNVIVIMTDDLGYGDAGCYGAKPEQVSTPNIDRLAAEGVRFTDGHSASSVCTPSRASLLTGDYAWRHPRGSGILPGDAPLFLKPGSYSLPGMFKERGYTTGVIGKWHLGLGEGNIDWNRRVAPGPNEIGFDDSFLIPATGDRTPTVFLRDGLVVNLDPKDPITVSYKKRIANEPTGTENPELATVLLGKKGEDHLDGITAGVSRIGFMTGGMAARWNDRDISDTLLAETGKFLEKNKDRPFFLYLATHGIHEPRIPHQRFVGKSGAGIYGDQILELDDLTGGVLDQLKKLNLDGRTLIVFTSDNGGSIEGGNGRYDYGKAANRNGHPINGVLRGAKGTIYEGGTRVPFIVRWPGRVPAGKVSPALVSQTDLAASFATLIGAKLPAGAARDSENVLPALLGTSETGRTELLEHLMSGPKCALRRGDWKYINGELYDLSTDLGEHHNLAKEKPELAKEMAARLNELVTSTGTRDGSLKTE